MNAKKIESGSFSPKKIAVVGLGYVGLPVATAFAERRPTVGFDINLARVEQLRNGIDKTGEISVERLKAANLQVSADPSVLKECDFIIVGVPTPIDANKQPNLSPLMAASKTVGQNLSPGTVVVFESTVYPGVTEDVCAPILSRESGMSRDQFRIGYSPERINPGDGAHTLSAVVKVVSGEDEETLEKIATVYSEIVEAGVFRASSIRVAESAKVIENVQRDINVALMNELSIIFERLNINTRDVLEAAGSKWNFNKYSPGLVGGHCIGVDPYYLTAKAESVGYHPQMILAGRRINDNMSIFVAQKLIKMLIAQDVNVKHARIGVFGVTFKENVTDCRNSKVFTLIEELKSYGSEVLATDPYADPHEVLEEYGVHLCPVEELVELDAVLLAVGHKPYCSSRFQALESRFRGNGVVVDIRGVFRGELPDTVTYWCL